MTLTNEQLAFDGFVFERPGPVLHQDAPQSAVVYRVGGRLYPMKHNTQCHVCNSDYRTDVEDALLRGRTYRAIENGLPEDCSLSARNIGDHVRNKHLPMDLIARTSLIEERAREMGHGIEEYQGNVIDQITLARTIITGTVERINTGEMDWSVADALKAAALLEQHDMVSGTSMDHEAIFMAFRRILEAASRVSSPEQMRAMGEVMRSDPILNSVLARLEGEDNEVVEVTALGEG
jgi:hypothetical protein